MNQSIQFPDREWWDSEKNAVCFVAIVNGFQMHCAITADTLGVRYGENDLPLHCFQRHRWDLEEEASDAIRHEQEDEEGWIWLY